MKLESKYILGEEIGAGASARVFSAQDQAGNQVALKIMLNHAEASRQDREHLSARFLQEGKTLARLSHAHIPRIVEIGEWQGSPAIAMELIQGRKLYTYIQNQPSLKDVVLRMAEIADALHYAHTQGVVHRDIKPDNILISDKSGAWLMDFGVARQEESVLKTIDGTMLGTIAYMAPEQLYDSSKADARSDIYSLGVLMYELFTGQLPFDGESPTAVILKVFNSEPTPPRQVAPHLPASLESLIMSCLQKDAGERVQTARQIFYALRNIAVELGESDKMAFDINQTQPGVLLRQSQPLPAICRTLGDLDGLRMSKARQSLTLELQADGSFNQFGLILALDAAIEDRFTGALKVKARHEAKPTFWFKGVVWFTKGQIQHAQLIRDPRDARADLRELLSTDAGQVQRAENTPAPQDSLADQDSRQLLEALAQELDFEWSSQARPVLKGSISYLHDSLDLAQPVALPS